MQRSGDAGAFVRTVRAEQENLTYSPVSPAVTSPWCKIMKLGKLTRVDLRQYWKHEALDFTRWLAEPENVELLSDDRLPMCSEKAQDSA